ncbi:MAG: ribbon-helix-helix domain-containing protein [Candidatus Poseidoniales archaeon]|jgi:hypothetical protein|nr:ribbon-helix-helix domain-containing protein [archaeon]MDA0842808.1 ribbon-helix-helix domain-containing protein [archaeon]MDA1168307.1 ribbon-helix-helix domain-containing protein [archaeon]
MVQPTVLVSFRLSEEDAQLLDMKIGQDGARNRSDVIRTAVEEFLHGQPEVQGMDSIRIPLGIGDKKLLAELYQLRGITREHAAQQGLKTFIDQELAAYKQASDLLQSYLDDAKASTERRSEYQE